MNAKRLGMIVLWVLALVLPGGLPLLAAWLGLRAARSRGEGHLPAGAPAPTA